MCRLLGVVAAAPAPIADLVPDELRRFEALAEVHPHGWGIAWVAESVEVITAPERAGATDAWRHATRHPTDAALLHIRQASPGMPHVMANTHPFAADGTAFAHNGHAHPTAALDALISTVGGPQPGGDTDSERYFSLVRTAATEAPLDEALLDVAERIARHATTTSLNALALTQHELVAIAWWHEPVILAAGDGETDRDYRLWYRVADDRVVVASAHVADAGPAWQELPHGHALTVDRGTLRVRITALEDLRAVA